MESYWMREAGGADIATLAVMNAALIRDEGGDNPMDTARLAARMVRFLSEDGYKAVLFGPDRLDDSPAGYALYRLTPHPYRDDWEEAYIRQLYVAPPYRRRGVGREAVRRLIASLPPRVAHVGIDVLAANARGAAFWQAVGFAPHAVHLRYRTVGQTGGRS